MIWFYKFYKNSVNKYCQCCLKITKYECHFCQEKTLNDDIATSQELNVNGSDADIGTIEESKRDSYVLKTKGTFKPPTSPIKINMTGINKKRGSGVILPYHTPTLSFRMSSNNSSKENPIKVNKRSSYASTSPRIGVIKENTTNDNNNNNNDNNNDNDINVSPSPPPQISNESHALKNDIKSISVDDDDINNQNVNI